MSAGWRNDLLRWIAIASLSLSLGCGGGPDAEPETVLGPPPNDALVDLRDLLQEVDAAGGTMPKRLDDLTQHEAMHPAVTAFLQNGSVVYVWGSRIQSQPGAESTVIAHEATADSQGGWVLLQDGNVRQMTREEFVAAKKPTGET